jgi:hypothetical protein
MSWPLEMAVAKLVAGWMAGAVLGMAIVGLPQVRLLAARQASGSSGLAETRAAASPSLPMAGPALQLPGRLFRLLAGLVVGLAVLSLAPQLSAAFAEISIYQAWGAMILIGMGLLQLGFTAQPLPIVLGLLTVLSGFEILYASVEASTLVAGLLAVINLSLALVGAYLLVSPQMEADE